jgi:hypothetical protein
MEINPSFLGAVSRSSSMNHMTRSSIFLTALLILSVDVYSQNIPTNPPQKLTLEQEQLKQEELRRKRARKKLVPIAKAVQYSEETFKAAIAKYERITGKSTVETDFLYYCPMKSAPAMMDLLKTFEAETKRQLSLRIIEAFKNDGRLIGENEIKFKPFLFEPMKVNSELLAESADLVYTPNHHYFVDALIFPRKFSITASVINDPVKGRTYTFEQLDYHGYISVPAVNVVQKTNAFGDQNTDGRTYECQIASSGQYYKYTMNQYKNDGSTIIRPTTQLADLYNPFVYLLNPDKMTTRSFGERVPTFNLIVTFE